MYSILRVFNMRLAFLKVSRNAYIFKRTGFIYIENVASNDWNTWITSSFEFRSTNLHHSSMGKIVRWKIFLTFAWSFRTAWSMVLLFCTVSIYIFLKLKIIFFLLLLVLSFFFCCNIVQWTLAFHCHNHYHRILRIIMGTTVVHIYESSIILLALYSNYHRLI